MQTKITRPPGPVVPGWTMAMTNLSPVRMEFDSLNYILTNAEKFGEFYGVYVGDMVTYVVSSPTLAHEILVERANEFHKAAMLRKAIGPLIGNGLLTSEGDFWKRQRKLAQPAFHFQRIENYGETMVQQTLALLQTWRDGEMRDICIATQNILRSLSSLTQSDLARRTSRRFRSMRICRLAAGHACALAMPLQ